MEPEERLKNISVGLSIPTTERHIFLCAEPTTPKCAPYDEGAAVWRHLKTRLKQLGVTSAPPPWSTKMAESDTAEAEPVSPGGGRILRTKADCLRLCEQGPIAVVYPDGIWYHSVTIPVLDRIIDEHLLAGSPVEEYVFARTGAR